LQGRKWPHLQLKSPGLKTRTTHLNKNNNNIPTPLSISDKFFSSSRSPLIGADSVEEAEQQPPPPPPLSATNHHSPMTPPSPNSSTPSTPTPDSSVFALVQFGGGHGE
jgi:hypothetical protein